MKNELTMSIEKETTQVLAEILHFMVKHKDKAKKIWNNPCGLCYKIKKNKVFIFYTPRDRNKKPTIELCVSIYKNNSNTPTEKFVCPPSKAQAYYDIKALIDDTVINLGHVETLSKMNMFKETLKAIG